MMVGRFVSPTVYVVNGHKTKTDNDDDDDDDVDNNKSFRRVSQSLYPTVLLSGQREGSVYTHVQQRLHNSSHNKRVVILHRRLS